MAQIITDYYHFKKVAIKAKTRMDCVESTRSYPAFEEKRNTKEIRETEKRDACRTGALYMRITDIPDCYKMSARRKADKILSMKTKSVSSLYIPDASVPYGYGDAKETSDALLFIFDGFEEVDGCLHGEVEVFVCRGNAHNKQNLYTNLVEGYLDEEIERARGRAVKE